MLEDMVADDRIEMSSRIILLDQGSTTNLQTAQSGVSDRHCVGFKSLSFPSEFAQLRNRSSVSESNLQNTPVSAVSVDTASEIPLLRGSEHTALKRAR